jgi:hypothetical protein
MARKPRPAQVEEFCSRLSPEQIAELTRVSILPGIRAKDIQDLLYSWGYTGSLQSVYTWWDRVRTKGEEAEKFNQMLQNFQGADTHGVLNKLLVILDQQLENAIASLTSAKEVKSDAVLRALPQLADVILRTSNAINTQAVIKDRAALELSGAALMAAELRVIFADSPFEGALEEGIKSVMAKLESHQQ